MGPLSTGAGGSGDDLIIAESGGSTGVPMTNGGISAGPGGSTASVPPRAESPDGGGFIGADAAVPCVLDAGFPDAMVFPPPPSAGAAARRASEAGVYVRP